MQTIRELIGQSETVGDVGVEVEVEASRRLPESGLPSPWLSETDGSLRGYSMEYITNGPVNIENISNNVSELRDIISPAKVKHSFRAGVHIHVNCQQLTISQVINFACVYYCIETALTKFCGESREGNHFCLRLKDAEYPMQQLLEVLRTGNINYLGIDNLRYSALNLRALTNYGSLEFRGMETMPDLSKIVEWAQILVKIRDYASTLSHRSEIAYEISAQGPENWVKGFLGDELFDLINYSDFEADAVSNMRRVQPLIYYRET